MAPVSNLLAFLFPIVKFIVKLILLATLYFPISEYVWCSFCGFTTLLMIYAVGIVFSFCADQQEGFKPG